MRRKKAPRTEEERPIVLGRAFPNLGPLDTVRTRENAVVPASLRKRCNTLCLQGLIGGPGGVRTLDLMTASCGGTKNQRLALGSYGEKQRETVRYGCSVYAALRGPAER
jgi:hypothetical protein